MGKTGKTAKKRDALGDAILADLALTAERFDTFPVKDLVIWGGNPRTQVNEQALKELEASVSRFGVQNPLKAFWENDELAVFDGGRRLRVCKELGIENVPLDVYYDLEPKMAFLLGAMYNISPDRMTPFDEGRAFLSSMENYNCSPKDIAQMIGCSEELVLERIAIFNFPEEVKDAITDNELTMVDARKLLRCPPELQIDMARELKDFKKGCQVELERFPEDFEIEAFLVERLGESDSRILGRKAGLNASVPRSVAKKLPPQILGGARGRKTATTDFEIYLREIKNLAVKMLRCLDRIEKLPDEKIMASSVNRLIQEKRFTSSVLDCVSDTDELAGAIENLLNRLERLGHDVK